jgi:probable HAF family extracellular repeat protein
MPRLSPLSIRSPIGKLVLLGSLLGAMACEDPPTSAGSGTQVSPEFSVTMGPSGYSTPVDIGFLPAGINDNGVIAGQPNNVAHLAALLVGNTISSIGTVPGWPSSFASDLNNKNQVVGHLRNDSDSHAFVYDPGGGIIDINEPGWSQSYATGINNGATTSATIVVGCGYEFWWSPKSAFRWSPFSGMQELHASANQGEACAQSVNDQGVAVGYWRKYGESKKEAFLWLPSGSGFGLGTLGSRSEANDINNNGWVVGHSLTTSGALHGFLWRWKFGMQDLGPLSTWYVAKAVSDKGRIVGFDQINKRTFTWYQGVFSYLPDPDQEVLLGTDEISEFSVNMCGTIVAKVFFKHADGIVRPTGLRWVRRSCD